MSAAAARRAAETLSTPRHVRHHWTLVWWVAVLLVAGTFYRAQEYAVPPHEPEPPVGSGEDEAFLSVVFGKLSDDDPEATSSSAFRSQLQGIRQAGFTPVSLSEIARFLRDGVPLPSRPVLLTFDQARRESLEIADPILAAFHMNAVVFSDLEALDAANLELVSIHRLRQFARSGRWEVGVSSCQNTPAAAAAEGQFSADVLRRERLMLEDWIERPVLAADCQRAFQDAEKSTAAWSEALRAASYSLGFTVASPGANYQDDPQFALRRVRVQREWRGQEFAERLQAHVPRRDSFTDEVRGNAPRQDWIVDRGELQVERGGLRLRNRPDEQGALAFLGGTERWRDAEVEVRLRGPVVGQFWVYVRRPDATSFVRLGVVGDRVLLQESGSEGETRQLASRPLGEEAITLGLRVDGSRALGMLNGAPLTERPAQIGTHTKSGPIALAAWSAEGPSSARIERITARPLTARCALIPAAPDERTWEEVRRRAPELSAISPIYFSWENGKGRELGPRDQLIEVLARFERLRLLPGVMLHEKIRDEDLLRFAAELARWATDPRIDGLNLIVPVEQTDVNLLAFVAAARHELAEKGKELAVTAVDGNGEIGPDTPAWNWFFHAGAESRSLRIASAGLVLVERSS